VYQTWTKGLYGDEKFVRNIWGWASIKLSEKWENLIQGMIKDHNFLKMDLCNMELNMEFFGIWN
jgi:hypothetical protein